MKSNKRWSKPLPSLEGEYKSMVWFQFFCDTIRKLDENFSPVQEGSTETC